MVEANRCHSEVISITEVYMFTPSLYQSKEKEIVSDSRMSNLPFASCFILGLPVAHVLCRPLSLIKRQHGG